jgi:hypothetical protein
VSAAAIEAPKAEPAPQAAQAVPQAPQDPRSLEIASIREQINAERKKRMDLIGQLSALRNKLRYKENEHEALAKLLSMSHEGHNVGRLRRMKESLEFRIATEAATLNAEKELIKKLTVINGDLEDALKIYRFKRKSELVAKDIEDLKKRFEVYREQIREDDKRLDGLYASLKALTGWGDRARGAGAGSGPAAGPQVKKKHAQQQEHLEISLSDIATIKNKKPAESE